MLKRECIFAKKKRIKIKKNFETDRWSLFQAGIDQERLTLALEPEAAALCCKCLEIQKRTTGKGSKLGSFDTGARFLVVDLGGKYLKTFEVIYIHLIDKIHT